MEAVDQLCSGKITATEYASALIDKAEEWECINSFAYFNTTQVGPLYLCHSSLKNKKISLAHSCVVADYGGRSCC